jgi:putative transposase
MASKRHKRYKSQEILQRLRQAEVLIGQGRTVSEACREIGVTAVTYCRSVRCSTSAAGRERL